MLLFVGRMMWYKGIRLILDGLRIARQSGLRFSMYFVGDGYDLPEIEKYTRQIGLNNCVYFTGKITDRQKLKTYFGRSDLFLFPSTYDTSGRGGHRRAQWLFVRGNAGGFRAHPPRRDSRSRETCRGGAKRIA